MKKIILIDGNNFMFRSFYATFYSGSIMRNSDGFPTNALFGFVRMLNKIIEEEKPEYMLVAFDKGINFRKEKYSFYKEGRNKTPSELLEQFPYAYKLLDLMGIKHLDFEPYEADDIIGTVVKLAEDCDEFSTLIVSSDKDLLQLINFETSVKLLKQTSHEVYSLESFKSTYGMDPIRMIDLKALMGDASDNIPGVLGVGEKTALKLLGEYKTLDGVYENIDSIKGSVKEKLIKDKENAYISKELATIKTDIDLGIKLNDLVYEGEKEGLNALYEELNFYSLIKNYKKEDKVKLPYKVINNLEDLHLDKNISMYLEIDNENYHSSKPLAIALKDKFNTYIIKEFDTEKLTNLLKEKVITTFDAKKHYKFLNDISIEDDLMISSFLLNKNVKEDITSIMDEYSDFSFKSLEKANFEEDLLKKSIVEKVEFIDSKKEENISLLKEEGMYSLYRDIEMPLVKVLIEMENEGMKCDKKVLDEIGKNIKEEIETLKTKIYTLSGYEFNISSPKQLGEVLFEKLNLPHAKKNKTGYKTDVTVLEKLINEHEVISHVLMYRQLTKLESTYIKGLKAYISSDGIIRPIFKQTLARTGRLSCTEPNLQNIPIKDDLGKTVRKAFVPKKDVFLSFDYSQIELRILAHISGEEKLINSFNKGEDIHKMVAADIFDIDISSVTCQQRSMAKAVIFGIIYGISGFGLGENLKINPKKAAEFIDKYYKFYPSVRSYMNNIVKEAKISGEVVTILGRVRKIDEINSANFLVRRMGERMALNTPMQGSSADIIKKAMVEVREFLIKNDLKSKLILQIHDELVFDALESEKEFLIKNIKKIMEEVIDLKVSLKAEYKEGKTWYDA